ncbi:MAG: hypothetical protein IT285_09590 [Bdellovibrionales bacterium]|nr:hypothetical protein [Bdellovibrionales bacterium]
MAQLIGRAEGDTLRSQTAQYRTVGSVFLALNPMLGRCLAFAIRWSEGIVILMVALSRARARPGLLCACFLAMTAGIVFPWFINDYAALLEIEHGIGLYVLPASTLAGAGVVFLRAWLLSRARGGGGIYHPQRARQLLLFGFLLLTFLAGYLWQFNWSINEYRYGATLVSYRSLQAVILLAMAVLMLGEYRVAEAMLRKYPVSRYHKLGVLPDSVQGLVLAMDLKGSEALFKERAANSGVEDLTAAWRQVVYEAVYGCGGLILFHAGDEVAAFWPAPASATPSGETRDWGRVEDFLARYRVSIAELRRENRLRHPQTELGAYPFDCRAAATWGDLRPIWENVGDARLPSWIEAGNSSPLVWVHRLLELEKSLPSGNDARSASRLVIGTGDWFAWRAQAAKRASRWSEVTAVSGESEGKHGVIYAITALDLEGPRMPNEKDRRPA